MSINAVMAISLGIIFFVFLSSLGYSFLLSLDEANVDEWWDEEDEMDSQEHPEHYNKTSTECIDYISDILTDEEYRGFLKGNVIKYLHREHYKGGSQDISKARVYLDWLDDIENF